MYQNLTSQQIQKLIDRFDLRVDLDEGNVVARRKDGRKLSAETVAKMIGMKSVPENWHERKDGSVSGL
jgi:hypothetical protein